MTLFNVFRPSVLLRVVGKLNYDIVVNEYCTVGIFFISTIYSRRILSQMTSLPASDAAIISASVVEVATYSFR